VSLVTIETSAMWSGDGARYVSLRAAPFERFRDFPRQLDPEEWRRVAETVDDVGDADPSDLEKGDGAGVVCQYALALCGEERWRGPFCYGDLSQLFSSLELPPDVDDDARAAWGALGATLGAGEPGEPWWVRKRFHRSCQYGLRDPAGVRELSRALDRTRICDRVIELAPSLGLSEVVKGLATLAAFLHRADSRGCWVLATEWR
jgi:hypothetical protein